MNLRDIKKDIDYVLSAFIEDCTVCAAVNPKSDDKVIADLMEDAVDLYNELRDKVTVKVEGSKKAYFNNLRKEILERTDALYTKLSEAVAKGNKAEEGSRSKEGSRQESRTQGRSRSCRGEEGSCQEGCRKEARCQEGRAQG